jgi:hypothetical protein
MSVIEQILLAAGASLGAISIVFILRLKDRVNDLSKRLSKIEEI